MPHYFFLFPVFSEFSTTNCVSLRTRRDPSPGGGREAGAGAEAGPAARGFPGALCARAASALEQVPGPRPPRGDPGPRAASSPSARPPGSRSFWIARRSAASALEDRRLPPRSAFSARGSPGPRGDPNGRSPSPSEPRPPPGARSPSGVYGRSAAAPRVPKARGCGRAGAARPGEERAEVR